jgi:gas vesicle protein
VVLGPVPAVTVVCSSSTHRPEDDHMHHGDQHLDDLADLDDLDDHTCPSRWPSRLFFFALGVGVGAVASYLGDPDRGATRRTQLQQKVRSKAKDVGDQAVDQARDATQRAVGSAIDAVPEVSQPSDAVLLERVRSEAIGPSSVPTAQLVTTVVDGVVELRGRVDTLPQREELLAAVAAVSGVKEVRDLTHLPDEPAPTRS